MCIVTTYDCPYPSELWLIFVLMNTDRIRETIRKRRRDLGYSQEYMAQILGISLNGHRKIEGGKTALINPRLNDISRVLSIPAENLLFENLSQSFLDQIAEKDSRIESLQKLLSESEMQRELLKAEIDCANSEYKASIESKNTLIGILKDKISKY